METYEIRTTFQASRNLTELETEKLSQLLSGLDGVNQFEIDSKQVTIEFYRHLQSYDAIKELLVGTGFPPAQPKKEGFLSRFVKKLAKDNKDTFGDKPLDCCDLNH